MDITEQTAYILFYSTLYVCMYACMHVYKDV